MKSPLCLACNVELCDDAITLPCHHSFCKSCLKKKIDHLHQHEVNSGLKCPHCETRAKPPWVFPYTFYKMETAPTVSILSRLKWPSRIDRRVQRARRLININVLPAKKKPAIQLSVQNSLRFKRHELLKWWLDRVAFSFDFIQSLCDEAIRKADVRAFKAIMKMSGHNNRLLPFLRDMFFVKFKRSFEDVDLYIYAYIYKRSVVVWDSLYRIANAFNTITDLSKLNWWVQNGLPLCHYSTVFTVDNIKVVDWWYRHARDSFLKLNVATVVDILDSKEELDWWRTTLAKENMEFMYTELAISNAISNNNIECLEWWSSSGLPLKIDNTAYFENCKVEILEWLKSNCPIFKKNIAYFLNDILLTSLNEESDAQQKVMTWCVENCDLSARKFIFHCVSGDCMDHFSKEGDVEKLQWWKDKGLPLRFTERAIDNASKNGHLEVLKWWKKNHPSLRYTIDALTLALDNGHYDVVEWWKTSMLPLRFNTDALKQYYNEGYSESESEQEVRIKKQKICDEIVRVYEP